MALGDPGRSEGGGFDDNRIQDGGSGGGQPDAESSGLQVAEDSGRMSIGEELGIRYGGPREHHLSTMAETLAGMEWSDIEKLMKHLPKEKQSVLLEVFQKALPIKAEDLRRKTVEEMAGIISKMEFKEVEKLIKELPKEKAEIVKAAMRAAIEQRAVEEKKRKEGLQAYLNELQEQTRAIEEKRGKLGQSERAERGTENQPTQAHSTQEGAINSRKITFTERDRTPRQETLKLREMLKKVKEEEERRLQEEKQESNMPSRNKIIHLD